MLIRHSTSASCAGHINFEALCTTSASSCHTHADYALFHQTALRLRSFLVNTVDFVDFLVVFFSRRPRKRLLEVQERTRLVGADFLRSLLWRRLSIWLAVDSQAKNSPHVLFGLKFLRCYKRSEALRYPCYFCSVWGKIALGLSFDLQPT